MGDPPPGESPPDATEPQNESILIRGNDVPYDLDHEEYGVIGFHEEVEERDKNGFPWDQMIPESIDSINSDFSFSEVAEQTDSNISTFVWNETHENIGSFVDFHLASLAENDGSAYFHPLLNDETSELNDSIFSEGGEPQNSAYNNHSTLNAVNHVNSAYPDLPQAANQFMESSGEEVLLVEELGDDSWTIGDNPVNDNYLGNDEMSFIDDNLLYSTDEDHNRTTDDRTNLPSVLSVQYIGDEFDIDMESSSFASYSHSDSNSVSSPETIEEVISDSHSVGTLSSPGSEQIPIDNLLNGLSYPFHENTITDKEDRVIKQKGYKTGVSSVQSDQSNHLSGIVENATPNLYQNPKEDTNSISSPEINDSHSVSSQNENNHFDKLFRDLLDDQSTADAEYTDNNLQANWLPGIGGHLESSSIFSHSEESSNMLVSSPDITNEILFDSDSSNVTSSSNSAPILTGNLINEQYHPLNQFADQTNQSAVGGQVDLPGNGEGAYQGTDQVHTMSMIAMVPVVFTIPIQQNLVHTSTPNNDWDHVMAINNAPLSSSQNSDEKKKKEHGRKRVNSKRYRKKKKEAEEQLFKEKDELQRENSRLRGEIERLFTEYDILMTREDDLLDDNPSQRDNVQESSKNVEDIRRELEKRKEEEE